MGRKMLALAAGKVQAASKRHISDAKGTLARNWQSDLEASIESMNRCKLPDWEQWVVNAPDEKRIVKEFIPTLKKVSSH